MRIITKKVYLCEYCNKLYQRRHHAEYHEKMCNKNPDNKRPCFECQHLDMKKTTIIEQGYIGEYEKNIELFYCNAKKIFLHTPQNEIKGNAFDLGFDTNHPMPRKCDDYKQLL